LKINRLTKKRKIMRQLKIQATITNRDSNVLKLYLSDVSALGDVVTPEQEVELAIRIQQGDEKALDELIKKNLRFVISVSKQFQSNGKEQLGDIISAGNIGLIEAAKRFDHTKGFKFISYAVWWIRQSIMQYLSEQSRVIRMPVNKTALMNKIKREANALEQELERDPTSYEISERIRSLEKYEGLDYLEIEKLIQVYTDPVSLDAPVTDESNSTMIDLLKGDILLDVNRTNNLGDLKKVMRQVIDTRLSGLEKTAVELYFGIGGGEPKTLSEIGEIIGLSSERARQLKEKGIRRMRDARSTKLTRQYLG
jgi:RNA polymerase primary sigma factor